MTGSDASTAGLINLYELSQLETGASGCVFCTGPNLQDLQDSTFALATVTFIALEAGAASFGLTLNSLADGNGDNLPASIASDPSVSVQSVPAPGTLALLAFGLPLVRRRRGFGRT